MGRSETLSPFSYMDGQIPTDRELRIAEALRLGDSVIDASRDGMEWNFWGTVGPAEAALDYMEERYGREFAIHTSWLKGSNRYVLVVVDAVDGDGDEPDDRRQAWVEWEDGSTTAHFSDNLMLIEREGEIGDLAATLLSDSIAQTGWQIVAGASIYRASERSATLSEDVDPGISTEELMSLVSWTLELYFAPDEGLTEAAMQRATDEVAAAAGELPGTMLDATAIAISKLYVDEEFDYETCDRIASESLRSDHEDRCLWRYVTNAG